MNTSKDNNIMSEFTQLSVGWLDNKFKLGHEDDAISSQTDTLHGYTQYTLLYITYMGTNITLVLPCIRWLVIIIWRSNLQHYDSGLIQ